MPSAPDAGVPFAEALGQAARLLEERDLVLVDDQEIVAQGVELGEFHVTVMRRVTMKSWAWPPSLSRRTRSIRGSPGFEAA